VTSLVGVLCRDGAVIGTDSAATFSDGSIPTIEQPTEKIDIVSDRFIVAGTGAVGLGQRFCLRLKEASASRVFTSDVAPMEACRRLCESAVKDFISTGVRMGGYGALLAFSSGHHPNICEFAVQDLQPELLDINRLWYTSMGSAKPITDPFLGLMRRVFWQEGPPTVSEAVFAVYWTLEHAIELNIGGVNGPIQIAVLEKGKTGQFSARKLPDEDFEEHRQNVQGAYQALRGYQKGQAAATAVDPIPEPPVR